MCDCFSVCSLHPEDGALLSSSQFSERELEMHKDQKLQLEKPNGLVKRFKL